MGSLGLGTIGGIVVLLVLCCSNLASAQTVCAYNVTAACSNDTSPCFSDIYTAWDQALNYAGESCNIIEFYLLDHNYTAESCQITEYGGAPANVDKISFISVLKSDTGGESKNGAAVHCEGVFFMSLGPVSFELEFFGISFNDGSSISLGGAISINTSAPVTFVNSRFFNNSAQYGGGLFISTNSTVTFSNVVSTLNYANNDGGGFYFDLQDNAKVTFNETEIKENQAGLEGGGIFVTGSSYSASITLDEAIISGNQAFGYGGGLRAIGPLTFNAYGMDARTNLGTNGGGLAITEAFGNIEESEIHYNNASLNGGGLHFHNTNIKITSAEIEKNNAEGVGGGIYIYQDPIWRTLRNTTENSILQTVSVSGNTAVGYGGGIYVNDSISEWIGSQFEGNSGKAYQSDSDVYCTEFAQQSGYCSRCQCLDSCASCPDNGCSIASSSSCICYVKLSLVDTCNKNDLPSTHVPNHLGLVLGLVFGLVLPIIVFSIVGGYVYYRYKKRKAYMAVDPEETSNRIHPL